MLDTCPAPSATHPAPPSHYNSSSREAAAHAQAALSPASLPAIRLLMREMEVAVREEDYGEAARLRDHPWMRLAEDINMHRWLCVCGGGGHSE